MSVTLRIEYYSNVIGWTAFPDVISGSVNIDTGFQGDMLFNCVATAGTLIFACWKNSDWHTSTDWTGTPVRVMANYNSDEYCLFSGWLVESDWKDNNKYTEIVYTAKDWFHFASRAQIIRALLYKNITSEEYIRKIGNFSRSVIFDLRFGGKVLPYAGDLAYRGKTLVEELTHTLTAGNGYLFSKYNASGQVIAGRANRGLLAADLVQADKHVSDCAILETESGDSIDTESGNAVRCNEKFAFAFVAGGNAPSGMTGIYVDDISLETTKLTNRAIIHGYTRTKYGNYVAIYSSSSPIPVPANSSVTVNANYTLGDVEGIIACFDFAGVGALGENTTGEATCFILRPSDYSANSQADGNGTDVKSYVTVEVFAGTRSADVRISNKYTNTIYVTSLKIYGNPIVIRNDNDYIIENVASVEKYGVFEKDISLAYDTNPATAQEVGSYITYNYGMPVRYAASAVVEGYDKASTMAILSIGVGDLVKISARSNEITVGQVYSIEYSVDAVGNIRAVYKLAPRLNVNGEVIQVNKSDTDRFRYVYNGKIDNYTFMNPDKVTLYIKAKIPSAPNMSTGKFFTLAGGCAFYVEIGADKRVYVVSEYGGNNVLYHAETYSQVMTSGWHDILVTVSPNSSPAVNILVDFVQSIGGTNTTTQSVAFIPRSNTLYVDMNTSQIWVARITGWNGVKNFASANSLDFANANLDLTYSLSDSRLGLILFDGATGIPLNTSVAYKVIN